MKSYIPYSLLAAAAACGLAYGQTAYTTPVGYVSQTSASLTDTIVSVPLRKSASAVGQLSADPDIATTPNSAVLTLAGSPGFNLNAFANNSYVKFKTTRPSTAAGDGQWFPIIANTADTITVDLNGAVISAVSGASLEVVEFWSLSELFDPASPSTTTDPATTQTAIVASTSQLASGRKTEILIPNLVGTGINLAPTTTYYVHAGIWKKQGSGATNFGSDQLWPDTYFIIRQPSLSPTLSLTYTNTGEVDVNEFDVGLRAQATGLQDNFVGLPRPVDVTLNSLSLGGTPAFISSTSQLASGRRDELLVFDNAATGRNKAPGSTYYFHAGIWKKQGGGATDFGGDVIKAGNGFIVRKAAVGGSGQTSNWNNLAPY